MVTGHKQSIPIWSMVTHVHIQFLLATRPQCFVREGMYRMLLAVFLEA